MILFLSSSSLCFSFSCLFFSSISLRLFSTCWSNFAVDEAKTLIDDLNYGKKLLKGLSPLLFLRLHGLSHIFLLFFILERFLFTLYLLKVEFLYLCRLVLLSLSLQRCFKLFVQRLKVRRLLGLDHALSSFVLFYRLQILTRKLLLKIFLHSWRQFGLI